MGRMSHFPLAGARPASGGMSRGQVTFVHPPASEHTFTPGLVASHCPFTFLHPGPWSQGAGHRKVRFLVLLLTQAQRGSDLPSHAFN